MDIENMTWPFNDPPNTAVFTTQGILNGEWIHLVTHDEDDGAWQFHPIGGTVSHGGARVVSLREMLEREPGLAELADLPIGWYAVRTTKDAPWERAPKDG